MCDEERNNADHGADEPVGDGHPPPGDLASFGVEGTFVRYLGELAPSAGPPTLEAMVDTAMRELSARPDDLKVFVAMLEKELARRSLGMPTTAAPAADARV